MQQSRNYLVKAGGEKPEAQNKVVPPAMHNTPHSIESAGTKR